MQIFPRAANTVARATLALAAFLTVGVPTAVAVLQRSSYATGVGVPRQQPIPFSHKHHVSDAGLDCRYCHTSVERSPFAGMPSTDTCMNCHRQLWNESEMLEPVRASYRSGVPIAWTRVYDLPDFVYFDHSIHVAKGVGCSTCHGRVDTMPLIFQASPLNMGWCIDCHRNPEAVLRPQDQVFNMEWKAPANQAELGAKFAQERKIRSTADLTSCSTCHR